MQGHHINLHRSYLRCGSLIVAGDAAAAMAHGQLRNHTILDSHFDGQAFFDK